MGSKASSVSANFNPDKLIEHAPPQAAPASSLPSSVSALPQEATEDDGDPAAAIGTPSDPLRPDSSLNLSDLSANQDLWARIRQGYGLPELDSPLVADHEQWYASRPDYVQRMTERASRYLFHVVEEIQRRKMPTELALLPFIESAFNPQAMSSARASGMWQFMPGTGKDFELKQNLFRDDRRDVLASTRAALDYLQRLYNQFGDWHLALAAYNWGEGNVQRAISKNLKAGLPTDYLSLNLPAETRNYVPKLHAVRNIIARPEAYGLTLTPIENHPYFVSVPIQRDMDSALAARLAGLPSEEFKALNPSLNKPVILAAGTPQVLLPYDNASLFAHNLKEYKGPLATWTAWVVPRTMRPADVAKQVGMSESSLREVNHIPPKMLVKAGSALLVPRSQHRVQDVSESVADNAMMALAPDLPPLKRLVLKAGKKESVASVARRYKLKPQQVAVWNKVGANASFKKGQSIVVYVAVNTTVARAKPQKTALPATRVAKASVAASASKSKSVRPTSRSNTRVRVASAR
ncbi:MAG TPA: transglycosylase SLT domain-containing protein [Aquabacterium sp.]|nr:transglycosylase SLT domain-containing protein [Aquabacterium sp.]